MVIISLTIIVYQFPPLQQRTFGRVA